MHAQLAIHTSDLAKALVNLLLDDSHRAFSVAKVPISSRSMSLL